MKIKGNSITSLKKNEAEVLANILQELDCKIHLKISLVQAKTSTNYQKALEYVIFDSPKLWAKVFLNWECRDYQDAILLEGKLSTSLVLRLGRRLRQDRLYVCPNPMVCSYSI